MDMIIENQGKQNMEEKYKCKITVLKKSFNKELYEQYPYGAACECGLLEVGQEYISESRWFSPEGFCPWAWSDLRPILHSVHSGTEAPFVSCCTDGLRPVIFKLERIDR